MRLNRRAGYPSLGASGTTPSRPWAVRLFGFAVVGVVLLTVAHGLGVLTTTGLFHHDLQASELAVPPAPAATTGFAFLQKDRDGDPVRFDPCRTIHYVVHVGHGPLNGADLVAEGIRRLSLATGLRFHDDGVTDRVVSSSGDEKAGDPVWIGWAGPDETHSYDDVGGMATHEAIGVGGPLSTTRPDGREVYVTGTVTLRPSLAVTAGFGPGPSEGNVLLHELGHLVGLAHVGDPLQLMYPASGPTQPDGYGPGDLAGLYQLGAAGGCL